MYCRGEYEELPSLPEDIPKTPHNTYRDDGWLSVGDWLGTGVIAPSLISYLPFEEAKAFARKLNLKSLQD